MRESDLISLIIPVYNGEKYIQKRVRDLQKQSYKNIEIILVPNNCSDNSIGLCNELIKEFDNVFVYVNEEKGTSLARKRGILESKGQYILLVDQDDRYISTTAIEKMHDAIVEDRAQITEFNIYREYFPGVIFRKSRYSKNLLFSREELFNGPLMGATIGRGKHFSVHVWSKIYSGDLLRAAAKNINSALYFAEDCYLNLFAFTNELLKTASIRTEAYYIWQMGGFSSRNEAGVTLLHDYSIQKMEAIRIFTECRVNQELFLRLYSEALWSYRSVINELLYKKEDNDKILSVILKVESFEYIHLAKEYFRTHPEKIWTPEMHFMISDYSPDDYLRWCKDNIPKLGITQTLKRYVKRFIKT